MPRYAIVSDIHANLEALTAVLDDLAGVDVDARLCLGDVIGYGPDPAACVDIATDVFDAILMGNHEDAALRDSALRRFNERARAAIHFTRGALTSDHLNEIASWPFAMALDDLQIAHGSFGPDPYEYVYSQAGAARCFDGFDAPFGAIGHTHTPGVFVASPAPSHARVSVRSAAVLTQPSTVRIHRAADEPTLTFDRDDRVLLNPGAVGQPRDRNPDASYALLDTGARTLEIRRVPYDVERTARKIIDAGLPERLAQRIRLGA
ncbi:MAG: metallophosphoesterase [Phycisphaerales bacterium]|nr:MAG: metallophosphoesterase [Phycisphaerales bacterium]